MAAKADQIPSEIYLEIFSHLSPFDLLSVKATCRRFNILAQSNRLWYLLNLRPFGGVKQYSFSWQVSDAGFESDDPDFLSKVNWYSEWRWRHATVATSQWIEPSDVGAPVLAFATHQRRIVALLDTGTVDVYSEAETSDGTTSVWQCTGSGRHANGRNVFRSHKGSHAVSQLGFMDSIDTNGTDILVGLGSHLYQKDFTTLQSKNSINVKTIDGQDQALITTVHSLSQHLVCVGTCCAQIHFCDIRLPHSVVATFDLPSRPELVDSDVQSTPLGLVGVGESQVLCGGRFPAVLIYDHRRSGIVQAVYTGADLTSSLCLVGNSKLIVGGASKGRGSLYGFDLTNGLVRSTNVGARRGRSRTSILGVAARDEGSVFTCGGAGTVELFEGSTFRRTREIDFGHNQGSITTRLALIDADLLAVACNDRIAMVQAGFHMATPTAPPTDSESSEDELPNVSSMMQKLFENQARDRRFLARTSGAW